MMVHNWESYIKLHGQRIVYWLLSCLKRIIKKNKKLKNILRKILLPHLSYSTKDDGYSDWVVQNMPDSIEVLRLRKKSQAFGYQPRVSLVMPSFNTNHQFLRDSIDSIRSQSYENWELCIVDDASTDKKVRDIIMQYADDDSRIKYKFLEKNQHIAGATNEAVRLSSGEFIGLFDHDDILWPNALHEVVKALNEDTGLDFIYTDEDKVTEDRLEHLGPFFKPDYNPDFLHSVNYVTHFAVIRKTLYDKIGGERAEYNGAQDWDLFLRVFRATEKIHHVAKVVYSWRIHSKSTAKSTDAKPYVVEAQRKAITEDLKQSGYREAIIEQDIKHSGYWRVTYPVKGNPLISIVIPTKNQYKVVKRCVDSIYSKTTYENFEIILVDTGTDDSKVLRWYEKLKNKHNNITIIEWPEQPFSYARSCNQGARAAKGELLLMLNNDTEVLTPDWLQLMAGDTQRKEIGVVGALLFFPDGRSIQHAGVGVGLGGVAANSFSMMTLDQPMSQTQHLMINTKHNMTAVTAACMMMRKSLYEEVGGFDEEFRVTYNDVDLCLRLYEKGYQNVYTPHVRLLHHESMSVGQPTQQKRRDIQEFKIATELLKKRWKKYVGNDPNLNPNLRRDNATYELFVR